MTTIENLVIHEVLNNKYFYNNTQTFKKPTNCKPVPLNGLHYFENCCVCAKYYVQVRLRVDLSCIRCGQFTSRV
jgi:hypothetical protein